MSHDPMNPRPPAQSPFAGQGSLPPQIPPPPRIPPTSPPPPLRDRAEPSALSTPPAAPEAEQTPVAVPGARERLELSTLSAPPVAPGPILSSLVAAGPGASPERALAEQLEELERWARVILRRMRVDSWLPVALRMVCIALGLCALVVVPLGLITLATILIALAGLLLVVDLAWIGTGSARAARLRAVHDLRELQNAARLKWDRICLTYAEPGHPKRVGHAIALLDAIRNRREVIQRRLCDIEPNPEVRKEKL